jgi:hypothetical protein
VFAASEDWGRAGVPADGSLVERIDRAARELAAAVAGVQPSRSSDTFENPVPFEDLLGSRHTPH